MHHPGGIGLKLPDSATQLSALDHSRQIEERLYPLSYRGSFVRGLKKPRSKRLPQARLRLKIRGNAGIEATDLNDCRSICRRLHWLPYHAPNHRSKLKVILINPPLFKSSRLGENVDHCDNVFRVLAWTYRASNIEEVIYSSH